MASVLSIQAGAIQEMHTSLLASKVPIRWKNGYEVIIANRARHLYFDLEQKRPAGVSKADHDTACWAKVQHLKVLVYHAFR